MALLHGASVGIPYFKVQELCGNSQREFQPIFSAFFYALTKKLTQPARSNPFPHEYEEKDEQQNPDREWAE